MFKVVVLFCALICVIVEARPKWQFLPPVPGYVPVYIRAGDTPLYEINPELAEAFHVLPAGRSSGKHVEAEQDLPDVPTDVADTADSFVDRRPYESKILDKKTVKKVPSSKPDEMPVPVERK